MSAGCNLGNIQVSPAPGKHWRVCLEEELQFSLEVLLLSSNCVPTEMRWMLLGYEHTCRQVQSESCVKSVTLRGEGQTCFGLCIGIPWSSLESNLVALLLELQVLNVLVLAPVGQGNDTQLGLSSLLDSMHVTSSGGMYLLKNSWKPFMKNVKISS